ncbi:hypothetical protein B0T26DRAFT_812844 [Lasiosphaeria miniovina]|uniref:Uncharacterized protein n=1 Tax=Lasiosphaeria miniovina TaxID=1954250 RepID=A0AA40DW27_9PEZI|nr:uncharacterized protein B0T26DRAFT_812844 [Lasiosphaeria miniovina]KAK0718519.1 hypothetical protein B0T26DRAFT_812844 [Lasiosphaeria miniovina]
MTSPTPKKIGYHGISRTWAERAKGGRALIATAIYTYRSGLRGRRRPTRDLASCCRSAISCSSSRNTEHGILSWGLKTIPALFSSCCLCCCPCLSFTIYVFPWQAERERKYQFSSFQVSTH